MLTEQRDVDTLNVYILRTKHEGIYDVRIPDLTEDVLEITGSYYVIPIIEKCVEAILGTNRFNLQFFGSEDVIEKVSAKIYDE